MNHLLKSAMCVVLVALPTFCFAYEVQISEPAKDRAYHRPAQSIDVQATVFPALEMGHTTVIFLNGQVMAD